MVPPILKDIGLGASLYLLTLKQFIWFFFVLSLLNMPLLLIFNSGKASNFVLGNFDLGNLGDEGPVCVKTNLAQNVPKVELKCASGNLKRIVGIGLNKEPD